MQRSCALILHEELKSLLSCIITMFAMFAVTLLSGKVLMSSADVSARRHFVVSGFGL